MLKLQKKAYYSPEDWDRLIRMLNDRSAIYPVKVGVPTMYVIKYNGMKGCTYYNEIREKWVDSLNEATHFARMTYVARCMMKLGFMRNEQGNKPYYDNYEIVEVEEITQPRFREKGIV